MNDDFERAHLYGDRAFTQRLTTNNSIIDYLLERSQQQPDDAYILAPDAEGNHETLTYRQLDQRSQEVAHGFRSQWDAQPGELFALTPINTIHSVVTLFGILRSGCSILFLNPEDPNERIKQQMSALPVKALLDTSRQDRSALGAIKVPISWEQPQTARTDEHTPGPYDKALYFGTSGSTAASKIVSQAHYNAVANGLAMQQHHGLKPGDRFLGCLPIHHVNGLHLTLFATLLSGATAILLEKFDPSRYQDVIERYKPRIASVVPSILETLLFVWKETRSCELEYFISAAAPLSAVTNRAVYQKLGIKVMQGYGLTETTNFSTTLPRDISDECYRRLMIDAEIPSIGTAVFGNEVAILKEDGTRARPGEMGEICMRGHNVMLGYEGNEPETRKAFRGGWFHSLDLGYEVIDEETQRTYIVITGRIKNIAKVLGANVSLDEMDRSLMQLPGIRDCACFTIPNQLLGEEIIAAIVPTETFDTRQYEAHLRQHFSATVLPARYLQADAIPRTPTGKIQRGQLPLAFGITQRGN